MRGRRRARAAVRPGKGLAADLDGHLASGLMKVEGAELRYEAAGPTGSAESGAGLSLTSCSPFGVPTVSCTDVGVSAKAVFKSGSSK